MSFWQPPHPHSTHVTPSRCTMIQDMQKHGSSIHMDVCNWTSLVWVLSGCLLSLPSFLLFTLDSSFKKGPNNKWLQTHVRVWSPGWVLQHFSCFVLWPVPSERAVHYASTCRRGQHKQSVSIGLPRNTKPAHHSAALSLPSWTLIPCSRLYALYNLSLFPSLCVSHFLFSSAPSNLIGLLRLCPHGFIEGKKVKCHLNSDCFCTLCCFFCQDW